MKIQSLIKGFSGEPACVYATYDEETGVTVIVKESKWTESRWKTDDDLIIISNENVSDRDVAFTEDQLLDSITDFFALESGDDGELVIETAASACNPQRAVEFRGIKDGKRYYDARANLANKHVAALAIAHYVKGLQTVADIQDMAEDLNDLMYGYIEA